MLKVQGNKTFLTGNLAGLTVPVSFPVATWNAAMKCLGDLQKLTQENPGEDCVTKDRFYTSNLFVAK